MNNRTADAEFDVSKLPLHADETPVLTPEQLMLIAGGQCTTNSI